MTTRLITVLVEGIGDLKCGECEFVRVDDQDDEEDDDETDRYWCDAFKRWIQYDEDAEPGRLDVCIASEVQR